MNYGVHAVMYFYFFLQSCGYRPWWNYVVTALQISQMFVGIVVCTAVFVFKFQVRAWRAFTRARLLFCVPRARAFVASRPTTTAQPRR